MAPLETASGDREPDTYAWKTAPAHLKTRRQLRAAGLAPGGHAPVAQTTNKRFGRTQITYFYDVRLAVPKRTASPAQRQSAANAALAHRAYAAARHGLTPEELHTPVDPGPGWTDPTTHKEESTMSDNVSHAGDNDSPETIAARLRGLATVDEGSRHLAELNLNRDSLQAVAAELGITRLPAGLSRTKLTDRVLQQAIGARRKFEGLRSWGPTTDQQVQTPTAHQATKPADLEKLLDQAQQVQTDLARTDLEHDIGELHDHAASLEKLLNRAQQAGADASVTRAQDLMDTLLRTDRDELERDPHWEPYYEAIDTADGFAPAVSGPLAPTGHGQRIAHLLAVVACNQARQRLNNLDTAVRTAESEGQESVSQLDTSLQDAIDRAEARLGANSAQQGLASLAPLVDALVYRTGSDIAADRLDQLVSDYALDWGVWIDAEQLSVEVDPDFDPVAAQTVAEAQSLYHREDCAVDIVAALPMADTAKAAATEALLAWTAKFSEPGLRDWLDTETERRAELGTALAAAKLPKGDQARVEFIVDFLRGDLTGVDLLDSPVFVDPGEEVRSRIPELLESFARNPEAASLVGKEISVMTETDRDRVRDAGKAIAAGEHVDTRLWPGYVDRGRLEEDLDNYLRDVKEMRLDADALAEGQLSEEEQALLGHKSAGSQDEASARIDDIAAAKEKLLTTVHDAQGLSSIERVHLAAIVEDIDRGRTTELPELLFADERTKCDVDFLRRDRTATQLANATKKELTQSIAATHAVDPKTRAADQLTAAVDSIADTLSSVASGSQVAGLAQNRAEYREKHSRLGQALTQAGISKAARLEIGAVLDEHARTAGKAGADAIDRRDQWDRKVEHVAANRDNAIAQRKAADAGRAKPPEATVPNRGQQRACTARIDTALATAQAQAPAGIRQLHSMEVER